MQRDLVELSKLTAAAAFNGKVATHPRRPALPPTRRANQGAASGDNEHTHSLGMAYVNGKGICLL
jgi:hypothetical protein